MNPFPEDKRCAVSFSIDDGFWNSCSVMARLLEEYEFRATFNLVTHWVDPMLTDTIEDVYNQGRYHGSWPEWQSLLDRGHEIGCHTATHPALPTQSIDRVRWELDESKRQLLKNLSIKDPITFAFPYNQSSPEVLAEVRKHFSASRWGGAPLNDISTMDRYRVQSWWPYSDTALEEIVAKINQAKEKEAWLVIGLHGVGDEGWHPVAVDKFEAVLAHLADDPEILVEPFQGVINQVA